MSIVVADERRDAKRIDRKYVRPSGVVAMTGLAKSTVMEALWSGKLVGHRVGRAWLIPVEEVDRWIRGHDRAA